MPSLSTIFKLASFIAVVGWAVLFTLPLIPAGPKVVFTIAILLLCAIYTYLIWFGRHYDQGQKVRGSFWSLKGVISLFKSPRVVLAGWVHYLAFDLMVGLYITIDAANVGIAHWWLIPCLILTMMFGPAGLLLYFVMRLVLVQDVVVLL